MTPDLKWLLCSVVLAFAMDLAASAVRAVRDDLVISCVLFRNPLLGA